MQSPTIAVYCISKKDTDGKITPEFFCDEYAKSCLDELFSKILELGAQPVAICDLANAFVGGRKFSPYWMITKNEAGEISYEEKTDEITVDLFYERSKYRKELTGDELNSVRFKSKAVHEICDNKYLSYLFTPDLHENSALLEDDKQLAVFRLGQKDNIVVLKDLGSCCGKGVYVGRAEDYDKSFSYPILAQDFIDTRGGYKDLVRGMHDLRVVLLNGKPIHALLRQPPAGGYKATSRMDGASSRALYVQELPEEVIRLAKIIDERLKKVESKTRYFAADFGYNGKEWKLFEINANPSLAHESVDGVASHEFLTLLAESLVDMAKENAARHSEK